MKGMLLKMSAFGKRARLLGALAALLALVAAALWATNAFGWRAYRLADAEAFLGAPLPARAAGVQWATQAEKTRIVWLRFSLPSRAELDAFLEQLGLADALRAGFTPFPAPNPQEADIAWWQPGSAAAYSGLYANRGDRVIELLLDEGAPPAVAVYLRVYALAMR